MRTYARARNADGSKTWLTIETAAPKPDRIEFRCPFLFSAPPGGGSRANRRAHTPPVCHAFR